MDGHIKPCFIQVLIFFQSGCKDMRESAKNSHVWCIEKVQG